MVDSIDAVDYAILTCVAEHNGVWKKQVHEWISSNCDRLPEMDDVVSVQTIGRRIDQLHGQGLLETCIVSPDEISRDLIIAYKLVDAGDETMSVKRQEFLRAAVMQTRDALLSDYNGDDLPVNRTALLELICDEFAISGATRDELKQCSTQEILGMLGCYFFRKNLSTTIDPDDADRIAAILMDAPRLREPFESETVIDRIRAQLANAQNAVNGQVWKRITNSG